MSTDREICPPYEQAANRIINGYGFSHVANDSPGCHKQSARSVAQCEEAVARVPDTHEARITATEYLKLESDELFHVAAGSIKKKLKWQIDRPINVVNNLLAK